MPSRRVNKSCEACSARKVKCSRGQPCRRCAQLNVACHYSLHGLARLSLTPSSDVPSVVIQNDSSPRNSIHHGGGTDAAEIANDANPEADPGSIGNILEHVSASVDDNGSHSLIDETNPWLSWGWNDPLWAASDSFPACETGVGREWPTAEQGASFGTPTSATGHRSRIANIADARLDPVEHHRQCILVRLEQSSGVGIEDRPCPWLGRAQFPLLLKTYFVGHHRHTPIVHLPTLNIAECPTSLVFALVLVAASSIPSLDLGPRDMVALLDCAYQLAIESHQVCILSAINRHFTDDRTNRRLTTRAPLDPCRLCFFLQYWIASC